MTYQIAEKFKSVQGEGVYAGTPMAFIRFVGCSVGKSICSVCDTDFERSIPWQGGGEFTAEQLHEWSRPYSHICLTGGEPLDQNLASLLTAFQNWHDPDGTGYKVEAPMVHVETSGTKPLGTSEALTAWIERTLLWVCVSPKPGFREDVVAEADEVKVIMPGLGVLRHGLPDPSPSAPVWPTLQDALRWADNGKVVFLQPRNGKNDLDMRNLKLCQDIVAEHPQLRLSVQLHKILKVQ